MTTLWGLHVGPQTVAITPPNQPKGKMQANVQRITEHGDTVHIAWTMELSPQRHARAATVSKIITEVSKPIQKERPWQSKNKSNSPTS